MKKETILRKHGYKARAVQISRYLHVQYETEAAEGVGIGERLKTQLTFQSESQSYVWLTDRGRSRLIKH